MKFALRKLVLRIIPHSFIRFSRKKINLNYLFFGASIKNVGKYIVNDTNSHCPFYGMEEQLGQRVVEGFKACYSEYKSKHTLLRKYVLEIENCVIEPKDGWAITESDNKLVFDSIPNNSWRENYHPDYFEYKRNRDMAELLDGVVSINIIRGGENNYWHFLHDLLGEVALALQHTPANTPFLISSNLSAKTFFKQALTQSPLLASFKWIVRDKTYYRAKKAWFVQTMPNANEQFFNVQKLLQVPNSNNSNRKVFLTRSPSRIRFLKNSMEIETIAKKYNFEVVDTDKLSLAEQIALFSQTKWLIGIHGAGLTNLIYRQNAALKLLELLPGDYLQPHYFWLCKGMGHEYKCIIGSVASIDTSFKIPAVEFEKELASFVTDWI